MTVLINRKGRKAKKSATKKKDDYPQHYHVVYFEQMGKTRPGIHLRKVSIDGKIAFVHPDDGRSTADMVPSAHVFKEKADAEVCFTKDGVERWVVYKPHGGLPEVFKARVKTAVYKRHGSWDTRVVVARVDGKSMEVRWDTVDYPTEQDAYKHFQTTIADDIKDITDDLRRLTRRRKAFLKIQRKIRSMGIVRGYRKNRDQQIRQRRRAAIRAVTGLKKKSVKKSST